MQKKDQLKECLANDFFKDILQTKEEIIYFKNLYMKEVINNSKGMSLTVDIINNLKKQLKEEKKQYAEFISDTTSY